MPMTASVVWYLGCGLSLVGLLCLIRPMRWLGLRTRLRAGVSLLAGVVLASGALWGVRDQRIDVSATLLDRYVPVYQFNEMHALEVAAPAERVYAALFEVTADEIRFFRTLVWIRRFGQPGPESILAPRPGRSLLDTALSTTFRKLAEEPGREIVLATFVAAPASATEREWTPELFGSLDEPGYAKAAMNFVVEPQGPTRSVVRTETRIFATDTRTRRAFTAYWRTIYPGSALIRREWLEAVRRRAEGSPTARR